MQQKSQIQSLGNQLTISSLSGGQQPIICCPLQVCDKYSAIVQPDAIFMTRAKNWFNIYIFHLQNERIWQVTVPQGKLSHFSNCKSFT